MFADPARFTIATCDGCVDSRHTELCAPHPLMPAAQIPCVEMVALIALSDLEQLEGPWMELMQSKDPESVAVAFRLALAHLLQTSRNIQMADVIQASKEQTELQRPAGGCSMSAMG